mgnify:CR=1 FL=1
MAAGKNRAGGMKKPVKRMRGGGGANKPKPIGLKRGGRAGKKKKCK